MVVKACLGGPIGEGMNLLGVKIGCDVCGKDWMLGVGEEKVGWQSARFKQG